MWFECISERQTSKTQEGSRSVNEDVNMSVNASVNANAAGVSAM